MEISSGSLVEGAEGPGSDFNYSLILNKDGVGLILWNHPQQV